MSFECLDGSVETHISVSESITYKNQKQIKAVLSHSEPTLHSQIKTKGDSVTSFLPFSLEL